ncbi:hypothetical protein H4S06_002638 [Coemansia sp. BCRC 34490]|nr:hypothetical protein H4S06_002638 [Coemansia sp. BCRC 34490]
MGDPSSVYGTPGNKNSYSYSNTNASTNEGANFTSKRAQGAESKAATMAGIVMNGQQPDKGIGGLPSQVSMSPYHYGAYKPPAGLKPEKKQPLRDGMEMGVHTPDASSDLEGRAKQQNARSEPPASGDADTLISRTQPAAEDKNKTNGNGTTTTGYRRGPTAGLPRLSERLLHSYRSRTKRQLATKLNPLVDPRMYSNTQTPSSRRSHHEELMRRSMHSLVSATTRYDRVTSKSLSMLADIAGLYLMRIGEACRAHTDFANRIEPNLFDVMDCTSHELGIDWTSTMAWVSEWKGELGKPTSATRNKVNGNSLPPSGNPTQHDRIDDDSALTGETWVETQPTDSMLSQRLLSMDIDARHQRQHPGAHSDPEGASTVYTTDGCSDDIEAMIDSLDLNCFLHGYMGISDDIKGAIPSHLPPLVPVEISEDKAGLSVVNETLVQIGSHGETDGKPGRKNGLDDTEVKITSEAEDTHSSVSTHDDPLPGPDEDVEDDAEETPESVIAQIIHLTTSSLSALPPSVKADKALYGFFRPASKFDPSCAPEEIMPDFEIPDIALMPSSERIKSELSQTDSIQPGKPMFLVGDGAQHDVIGDAEEMWRQARYGLYQDIYDDAAYKALEEMNNAPEILRRRAVDDEKEIKEEEEKAKKERAQEEHNEIDFAANHNNDVPGSDVSIDDDFVDIDMGMDVDMDMDMDMDLDIDGNLPEEKSFQLPSTVNIAGNSIIADNLDNNNSHMAKEAALAPETVSAHVSEDSEPGVDGFEQEEGEPEIIPVPISSGLRGSGKPNWSNEWFTENMRRRLSRITAQDIVPCDSLFLSNPWASHRGVVDEVARAFVDSEGGGHLHETTPLEGFGPPANTYKVPHSTGSALKWTLHHIMQTKGTSTVDSLYTGRSSLAGGVSGDGVTQYVDRMCSLIKASAEEEAEMVVSGSFRTTKDKDEYAWADRNVRPGQIDLMEQLLSGADKRIPWAQNRLDIHILESDIADREPQPAQTKPLLSLPSASASAEPATGSTEFSTPAVDGASDAAVEDEADAVKGDSTPDDVVIATAEDLVVTSAPVAAAATDLDVVDADVIAVDAIPDVEHDYSSYVDIGDNSNTVDGMENEPTGGSDPPAPLTLQEQQPESKFSPTPSLTTFSPEKACSATTDVGGDAIELDDQPTEEEEKERGTISPQHEQKSESNDKPPDPIEHTTDGMSEEQQQNDNDNDMSLQPEQQQNN